MSQENVEIVRQACAVNRSGSSGDTIEQAMSLADPAVRFLSRLTSVEGATYKGYEGVHRYYKDMSDAWQEWHLDIDDIAAIGPDTVLADIRFLGTGHSGVNVELRSFVLWVVSGGKVLELRAFPSRHEALDAAGIGE
jgi:hypothetical protein